MKNYKPLSLSELQDDKKITQEMLIEELIPLGEPIIIYGGGGELKSAVVLNMCMNILEGKPVAGLTTKKQKIVWIALEGIRDVKPRVQAHQKEYGQAEIYDIWFEGYEEFTFGNDEDEDALSALIDANNIGLVVIDTLSLAVEGDISTGTTSGVVTKQMRRMCNELGITLIVIAHTGKDAQRGIKGASEFFNNVPCVIYIHKGVLKVTKQRSKQSGLRLNFEKKIVDDSICIEWVDESINPRHQHMLDSYELIKERSGEVARKDLLSEVRVRYPDKSDSAIEKAFNRDLENLIRTSKIGIVLNTKYEEDRP